MSDRRLAQADLGKGASAAGFENRASDGNWHLMYIYGEAMLSRVNLKVAIDAAMFQSLPRPRVRIRVFCYKRKVDYGDAGLAQHSRLTQVETAPRRSGIHGAANNN
jgi:hypothetical protein